MSIIFERQVLWIFEKSELNGGFKRDYKEVFEEYKLELYDNYQIEVTDISEYVKGDDTEYYYKRKEIIDQAMGLLYENSNGNIVVLVRKQDCVNFFHH